MIKINKTKLNNFRFFIDVEEYNTFDVGGQNMLVYGENGSEKSSLFRAFEELEDSLALVKAFDIILNGEEN